MVTGDTKVVERGQGDGLCITTTGVGAALAALRADPLGARAARIGVVCADAQGFVQMTTGLGGRRVVDWSTV